MVEEQVEVLRIDFLGRFRLCAGERPVPDSISMRGRELLALLVLESGECVLRERIASRLWPDSTEAQARTNLRRELHHLRRALPSCDRILETRGAYLQLRLAEHAASDLDQVRRALTCADAVRADPTQTAEDEIAALTAAARGYTGDLLPECFAEWLAPGREQLRQQIVLAMRRLSQLLEERRDLDEALRWARRLTEIDPLDEIAYRAQMRLHAAGSDRAAALHAFHRCANLLARELGVEPARETRDLYRELLEGHGDDPGDSDRTTGGPRADRPLAADPPAGSGDRRAPASWTLVGRAEARASLLSAWHPAEAGARRVVCLLGEPGIGKSCLADDVARQLERDGAGVSRARAYAAEAQLSYGPAVDWLRSPAVRARVDDLDPAWRAEIGRLLPEVLAPAGGPPAGDVLGPNHGDSYLRQRLFEAVARALMGGSRPVVLVLDDVQWCDPETLALLHYLSRHRSGASLYLLATARVNELADNQAAQDLLLALRQEGTLLEVELGPLAPSDMAALLRASAAGQPHALTSEATHRLVSLSEGNPLFALEALRAGLHHGGGMPEEADPAAGDTDSPRPSSPEDLLRRSPRVRGVLAARLAQLRPRALELAQCAAIIGRAFSFDVLRDATDLDEAELVPALDELWRRRIVREHSRLGYDFSHDALREAALQGLSPARARLLHRRVAQALELLHAGSLDEVSASLANHYDLAGMLERATSHYQLAARAASAIYAHRRAAELLDRGLELVTMRPATRQRDRQELALLLAQMPSLRALHGYAGARLRPVLDRARCLAEQLEDTQALFQVLLNLWGLVFVSGDMHGTLEVAERLRMLAALHPQLAAESHHALAGPLTHVGKFEAAIRHFESARRSYTPEDARRRLFVFGSDLGVFNCAWEAHALWLSGLEDRAVATADQAVSMARALGHAYSEALAHAYASVLHYMRRDRSACTQAADAAVALCERHGFAYYGHWGMLLGAWARAKDDPARAVGTMREALASLDAEGAWARRPIYLAALAEALAAAGQVEEALATLDQADARSMSSGESLWDPELSRLRAVLAPDGAAQHATRALHLAQQLRARPLALRSAVTLALVSRATADGDKAQELVRQALASLPEGGRERGRALRALASRG